MGETRRVWEEPRRWRRCEAMREGHNDAGGRDEEGVAWGHVGTLFFT